MNSIFYCSFVALGATLLSAQSSGSTAALIRRPDRIYVSIDAKPFTTYYFVPGVAKPYLMPLRTASGIVISRDFPVENDVRGADPRESSFEPHQRPLYFAHGDIDGFDFWSEKAFAPYYENETGHRYGDMKLLQIEEAKKDGSAVRIRARFALRDPNGRSIGEESQQFVMRGDHATRTIDCEFILYATAGPIRMGDTKEGTFGIRLNDALSGHNVHMTNSHGAEGEPAIWGKRADWVDYRGTKAGQQIGIAVFDHPSSYRHPTTWHAREYGLLAANPFGLREFTKDPKQDGSAVIPAGKTMKFRYRVLIHEGDFPTSRITQEYTRYAAEP